MTHILKRKKVLFVVFALTIGCKSGEYSKMTEYDDLYFTSKDRLEVARKKAPEAKVVDSSQTPSSSGESDTYIQSEEKKQPSSTTGQSDTYIYNFDSRTFEKVKPSSDTTGVNNQKK
jgi:hypothetical protein